MESQCCAVVGQGSCTLDKAPRTDDCQVKPPSCYGTARAWAVGIIGCLYTEWMDPAPDLQHPLCF